MALINKEKYITRDFLNNERQEGRAYIICTANKDRYSIEITDCNNQIILHNTLDKKGYCNGIYKIDMLINKLTELKKHIEQKHEEIYKVKATKEKTISNVLARFRKKTQAVNYLHLNKYVPKDKTKMNWEKPNFPNVEIVFNKRNKHPYSIKFKTVAGFGNDQIHGIGFIGDAIEEPEKLSIIRALISSGTGNVSVLANQLVTNV